MSTDERTAAKLNQPKTNPSGIPHPNHPNSHTPTGDNPIVNFIDKTSTAAAHQIVDAVTAETIKKASAMLFQSTGSLTQDALADFEKHWNKFFNGDLPALASTDEEKKLLPSSTT